MFNDPRKPAEAPAKRSPSRMRGARKVKMTDENQRIVWKYVEAVEDTAHEGRLRHPWIVERIGL